MILMPQALRSKAVFEGAPKHRGQPLFTFGNFAPIQLLLSWYQPDSF
jgi:hypothetical protein